MTASTVVLCTLNTNKVLHRARTQVHRWFPRDLALRELPAPFSRFRIQIVKKVTLYFKLYQSLECYCINFLGTAAPQDYLTHDSCSQAYVPYHLYY